MINGARHILPIVLFMAILASCSDLGTNEPMLPQVDDGNFILYVSNQSFALDPVDVKIYIDNVLAVNQYFYVKEQHTWVSFHFQLGSGLHTIRAMSILGSSDQKASFMLPDYPWCVADFWFYPVMTGGAGPTPKHFTINFTSYQPGFF